MIRYIARRIVSGLLVIFLVAFVTFFLMHQAPGGPFDEKKLINNPQTLEALKTFYGLDKPEYINTAAMIQHWNDGERNPLVLAGAMLDSQFFSYIFNAMQGNLGPSYQERGKQVEDILLERWPYSLFLGLVALVFALAIGVPLGIAAALKPRSIFDTLVRFIASLGVSVPVLVTGLLVIFAGSQLGWMTVTGKDWKTFTPYIAPALVLGFETMAFVMRMLRGEMIEARREHYIRTARAKGVTERAIVVRHMIPNVVIPVVTWLGPEIVALITGAVIIETIFGIPGIGGFMVESISRRDYSMIMGTTLVYAALIVVATLLVDSVTMWLDPRMSTHK